LLVFHVADRSIVESFIQNDPYVLASTGPTVSLHPTEICRVWTACASSESWPAYREHFATKVLPELRAVPGYLGANLYVRKNAGQNDILVETFWRSLDPIHSFAGLDLEAAVVAKKAAEVLTYYERRVRHYEVVISDHPTEKHAATSS
jgi:heme-degrading monooxygenase HmoA